MRSAGRPAGKATAEKATRSTARGRNVELPSEERVEEPKPKKEAKKTPKAENRGRGRAAVSTEAVPSPRAQQHASYSGAMKGFAPPLPLARGSPGTTKYSVFNLPTLREVQARKTQFTRV